MEEDIRRNGKLYLHQKRFGKRWRKVWCVLLAEGRRSVARLELYEHKHTSVKEGSTKHKADYKQVIRLRECIRISENEMSDCPKDCATFLLETTDKLYVFAAHQSEVEEWIKCLCEQAFPDTQVDKRLQSGIFSEHASNYRETKENSLYDTTDSVREFLVIAVGTEAAVRCNLYGEYILLPQLDCLLLKDYKTKQVLLKWPYCYVRKFGQDTLSFSFEAGRRCESGEGNFEFATPQGERLFNMVNEAIQNLPKSKQGGGRHETQSKDPETSETDRIYDDATVIDCLPRTAHHQVKMLNPAMKSFSLNAIQLSSQATSLKTNTQNEEPLYAMVSKAQPKVTSSTDPQTHWQNLKKNLHQFGSSQDSFTADTDISEFAFVVPEEEEANEETAAGEDSTDLLSDSIHQLAINDAFNNIGAEAIYADPQELEPTAEWDVDAVYDEPEVVIINNQRAHDGVDHPALHDFLYGLDTPITQITDAQSDPSQSSDDSNYDNFRLKGRRM